MEDSELSPLRPRCPTTILRRLFRRNLMALQPPSRFPLEPTVHVGFTGGPNPKPPQTLQELTKNLDRYLVVTLPGAFTPT